MVSDSIRAMALDPRMALDVFDWHRKLDWTAVAAERVKS